MSQKQGMQNKSGSRTAAAAGAVIGGTAQPRGSESRIGQHRSTAPRGGAADRSAQAAGRSVLGAASQQQAAETAQPIAATGRADQQPQAARSAARADRSAEPFNGTAQRQAGRSPASQRATARQPVEPCPVCGSMEHRGCSYYSMRGADR